MAMPVPALGSADAISVGGLEGPQREGTPGFRDQGSPISLDRTPVLILPRVSNPSIPSDHS